VLDGPQVRFIERNSHDTRSIDRVCRARRIRTVPDDTDRFAMRMSDMSADLFCWSFDQQNCTCHDAGPPNPTPPPEIAMLQRFDSADVTVVVLGRTGSALAATGQVLAGLDRVW
jgi:hypothetical protein